MDNFLNFQILMSNLPKRGRKFAGPPAPGAGSFIALGGGAPSSSVSSSSSSLMKRTDSADDGVRKRDFMSAFSSLGGDVSDSKVSKLSEPEATKLASQIMKLSDAKEETQLVIKLTEGIKYVSTNRVSPNEMLYTSMLCAFRNLETSNLLEVYPKLMKMILDMLVSWLNLSFFYSCKDLLLLTRHCLNFRKVSA